MSMELIAILGLGVTMIGVGALAGLMLTGLNSLRKEMQTQRGELQTLRTEMQAQHAQTQDEFKAIRAETQVEFQAVRTEMREEFKAQRKDINGLLGRMAHLEGLLEGLREAIAGRSVSVVGTAEAEDPGQYEQR